MKAESIIKLIRICVEETYFVFNQKIYIQVDGLAIGAATSGFMAELNYSWKDSKKGQLVHF